MIYVEDVSRQIMFVAKSKTIKLYPDSGQPVSDFSLQKSVKYSFLCFDLQERNTKTWSESF